MVTKLKAYNIDLSTGTPVLASAKTADDSGAPVAAEVAIGGRVLTRSLDARTAYIGTTGKVIAVNLYQECTYSLVPPPLAVPSVPSVPSVSLRPRQRQSLR